MVTVPSGARLTLHTADGVVPLRSLAAVPLVGHWSIPVLTLAGQLLAGLAGELETAGERGPVRVQAHLASDGAMLWLRPGLGVPLQVQRRDDVRAEVRLPLRASRLSGSGSGSVRALRPVPALTGGGRAIAGWDGTTISLSAGGVGVLLDAAPQVDRHHAARPHVDRLQIEVDLPDGRLVPAVIRVVARHPRVMRARFEQIDPVDRERLVRLVFEQQRVELAARARLARAWPAGLSRD